MLTRVNMLILKDSSQLQTAKQIFQNSNIEFTCEGKKHLAAALGTDEFKITYVIEKSRGMMQRNEKSIETC